MLILVIFNLVSVSTNYFTPFKVKTPSFPFLSFPLPLHSLPSYFLPPLSLLSSFCFSPIDPILLRNNLNGWCGDSITTDFIEFSEGTDWNPNSTESHNLSLGFSLQTKSSVQFEEHSSVSVAYFSNGGSH